MWNTKQNGSSGFPCGLNLNILSLDFSYSTDTEVIARNHSVLQAYQPGSAEEGRRQQSGCRHLRLGLQGASAQPTAMLIGEAEMSLLLEVTIFITQGWSTHGGNKFRGRNVFKVKEKASVD